MDTPLPPFKPPFFSSTKMECDYLNGWIKKRSHMQKSHPKVVNPRDKAGERKQKKKKKKKHLPFASGCLRAEIMRIHTPAQVQPSSLGLKCQAISFLLEARSATFHIQRAVLPSAEQKPFRFSPVPVQHGASQTFITGADQGFA